MIVLRDLAGRATALAEALHGRLEGLGVYRRDARSWLPHLTVLRFRERPRLQPPLPATGTPFRPVQLLTYPVDPTGARYEVLYSYLAERRRMNRMNRDEALDVALGHIERSSARGR